MKQGFKPILLWMLLFVITGFSQSVYGQCGHIITQPTDANVVAGAAATFSVTANAGVTYAWEVRASSSGSWFPITTGGSSSTYTIGYASPNLNGEQYRCLIDDGVCNEYTNIVNLNIAHDPPVISAQPTDFIGNNGNPVNFSATVQPGSQLNLDAYWQYRNSNGGTWTNLLGQGALNGSNVSNITPTNTVAPQDYGTEYRFIVDDLNGFADTSNVVQILVCPFNIFASSNETVNGTAGNPVNLTATVQGGNLRFEWLNVSSNTIVGAGTPSAQGNNTWNNTLTISNPQDGQQYRCVFIDTVANCTDTTAFYTLSITNPCLGLITTQPTDQSPPFGQPATFSIVATGSNLGYRWESKLPSATSWTTISGANTNSYTTAPINSATSVQEYRCIVKDNLANCEDTSVTATLLICQGIGTAPTDQKVLASTSATFTVTPYILGLTGTTYQWNEILPNGTVNTAVSTSDNHTIGNVSLADYGKQYIAIVGSGNTGCAADTSAPATLYVCPIILSHPTDEYVPAGSNAVFSTSVSGNNLRHTWQRLNAGSTWTTINTPNTNTLTLNAVTLADHGSRIRCVVTDTIANCSATTNYSTLFVNVNQPIDTVMTFIGDTMSTSGTVCINDTFIVPVYINGGNNAIGSFSMNIQYDELVLGIISQTNTSIAIHDISNTLTASGTVTTSIPNNGGTGTTSNNVLISYNQNANSPINFPVTTKVFELRFVSNSGASSLQTNVFFNNNIYGNNEYSQANTGTILPDDGFTDMAAITADNTSCGNTVTGRITVNGNTGKLVYSNSNLVQITLINSATGTPALIPNNPQFVNSPNGYSFSGVPDGQYYLTMQDFNVDLNGVINATDAQLAMLHTLSILPLPTPLENFAGETDAIIGVGASDAMQMSSLFTLQITEFDDGNGGVLSDWVEDQVLFSVNGIDVAMDHPVMVRGDLNASFNPSNLYNGQVSEVDLVLGETLEITGTEQSLEIPILTEAALEVGAISLVLNYPYDVMEIDDIQLNEKANGANMLYTIKNGRIRLSWFNAAPLQLEAGEALLTIHAKTLTDLATTWTPTITRGNETELANGMGQVLKDITLVIPELVLNLEAIRTETLAVKTFPNPVSEVANFNIYTHQGGSLAIEIYNAVGILVKSQSPMDIANGETQLTMDLTDLPVGQYTAKFYLEHENGIQQEINKLMVVR